MVEVIKTFLSMYDRRILQILHIIRKSLSGIEYWNPASQSESLHISYTKRQYNAQAARI